MNQLGERYCWIHSLNSVYVNLVPLITMCLNETYSKLRRYKHLSDAFPIQNGLNRLVALSSLLFSIWVWNSCMTSELSGTCNKHRSSVKCQ
jgi:hypothetical protein